MILSDLRDYLKEHRRVALMDLSYRFDTDPEVVKSMLDRWIKKGKVKKIPIASDCGGCSKCQPSEAEAYEWNDD